MIDTSTGALAAFDTPTLCNAVEAFALRPATEGFSDGLPRMVAGATPVLARAVTATVCSRLAPAAADGGLRTDLYGLVAKAGQPVLVVVQDLDESPGRGSFLGEMQATFLSRLGAVGIATNGAVRDLDQLRDLGFTTYAGGVTVSRALAHLVEVGVPVEVGGAEIRTGDLLHGDEHGLLVLPEPCLERLAGVAEAIMAGERAVLEWAASPAFDHLQILERLAAVKAAARELALG